MNVDKQVEFMGKTKQVITRFPQPMKDAMGHGLHLAQIGDKAPAAKPLKGFGGSSVIEIFDRFNGNTFRAVYTTKFKGVIVVLHAFMKKSKRGISTPKQDIDLIKERLKTAELQYQ